MPLNCLNMKGFLFSISLLLVSACAVPPKPIPSQPQIHNLVIDPELQQTFKIVSFTTNNPPDSLIEMQLQLANLSRQAQTVRYQTSWFDAQQRILGNPVWSSRLVQPSETVEIRVISTYELATSGRMLIRSNP